MSSDIALYVFTFRTHNWILIPMATHEPSDLDTRVTELESLFTHLQRSIQDLNDVIVDQDRWQQETNRRIDHLQRQLQALSDDETDAGPVDEQPE